MAQNKSSASGTSKKNPSVNEIRAFAMDKSNNITTLRDVNRYYNKQFRAINKEALKSYLQNVGKNEKNLRTTSRYLYYRCNILFRLINWYADMWELNCRKVVPEYDLVKGGDKQKILKSFNDTLDYLDILNMQSNMTEMFINIYRDDVVYALTFQDETGMFFYILDPDECVIDTRYSTGDFGFSIDMSKWKNTERQRIIEFLGSPLKEMYDEYIRTNTRWIHCPDNYAACFKFRTDMWDTVIPPFVSLFLQLAGLEDLVDIQAEADALSIYKLIYLPLEVLAGSKESDNWEITPDIAMEYFDRLLNNGIIPDGVGGAVVPGKELKVIDFSKTVDSDTNSVEQASNQILQTAGGGAILNANHITSTAAFKAWLKSESEFAISTLLPQIDGFVNRMLNYNVSNPCKVEHLPVTTYTKEDYAEQLLKSAQFSFPNRLVYNTCLGIKEKETLAMLYLEQDVLELQNVMKYPLTSSHTQSGDGESEGGRPTVPDDELSDSGERSRNS